MADPFVPDQLCPRCSSKLKSSGADNAVYCSSCGFFESFTVTGRGEDPSRTLEDERSEVRPPPVTSKK